MLNATLLLPSVIPIDVWAETALQMLDARDLAALFAALAPPLSTPPFPVGATFVAKRVLSKAELEWFAFHSIPVTLLRDWYTPPSGDFVLWFENGILHRDNDLPASECADCRKWYVRGKLHRDNDLPAIERTNGDREWYQHGLVHRDGDLPAVELADGTRKWFYAHQLHRENDLPAVELANGGREWYVHGNLHRDNNDLPAMEKANGDRVWYFRGRLHRENDRPAVIWRCDADCVRQEWWSHNRRHRDGGRPAVIESTGRQEWFVRGERRSPPPLVGTFLETQPPYSDDVVVPE